MAVRSVLVDLIIGVVLIPQLLKGLDSRVAKVGIAPTVIVEVRRILVPAPNPVMFLEHVDPIGVIFDVYGDGSFVRRRAGTGSQNYSALLTVRVPVEDGVLLRQHPDGVNQPRRLTFLVVRGDQRFRRRLLQIGQS